MKEGTTLAQTTDEKPIAAIEGEKNADPTLTPLFKSNNSKLETAPLKAVTQNDQYALVVIKGYDKNQRPFSGYVVLLSEDYKTVCNAVNAAPINLEQYRENIIYLKPGHEVSEKEHADALLFFGKHYSGKEYPTDLYPKP